MLNQALSRQAGATLVEALIALLIFSLGILGLVSLQAASIKNSIDAKYRADAAYLANQIIAQMWVDRSNIDSYAHYATVGASACAPGGGASTQANVTAWTTQLANALPGAAANMQSIEVTTPFANVRQVQVTVCWRSPQETAAHNFVATAQINT